MSFNSDASSIDTYKDYAYIMYVLCDRTSSFYSKIKNVINIPIVICSTGLSILNTTEIENERIVRYISIAFNLLIALSVAILNLFEITEKEYAFKIYAQNFMQLHNKINAEIARHKTIMATIDILHIISEYNMLSEQISFHVPSRIKSFVCKRYHNYKMPLSVSSNETNNVKSFSKYLKIAMRQYKTKTHDTSSNSNSTVSTSNEEFRIVDIYEDFHKFNNKILSPIQSAKSEVSLESSSPYIKIKGTSPMRTFHKMSAFSKTHIPKRKPKSLTRSQSF